MSDIPSARLVLLRDLDKCKQGESIRITGIWKKYDTTTNTAVIHYDGYEAEVNTSQTSQIIPTKGDIVQCLGEVIEEATFGVLRMNARIIRQVNTIHLDLYEKVVDLRNSVII